MCYSENCWTRAVTKRMTILQTATSVQEASDIFLVKFEAPSNVGSAVKKTRASYGEQYLKIYQNQKKEENKVSKIENAVARAEAIALDDSHGYDQVDRWGNPNYDCSGLVIRCRNPGKVKRSNLYRQHAGGSAKNRIQGCCKIRGSGNR